VTITAATSLREVAFVVCSALDAVGVTAVLTGGSAATVYAPEAIQSEDLDFIVQLHKPGAQPAGLLASLGYRLEGSFYVHETNPLSLDFPAGPLMVGGDPIHQWDTLQEGEQILHILTPSYCCRDRLAGFLFWNDRGSLMQAVTVAAVQRDRIDLEVIRGWCEREGRIEGFDEFQRRLQQPR
jgi:hypothetical protein